MAVKREEGEPKSGHGGSRPHKGSRHRDAAIADPQRIALIEAKRKLATVAANDGVEHIERIIKDGPGLTEQDNKLWQYAMNFAADRGGLPRMQAVEIEGAEMPPLVVQLKGFARPSDT